MSPRFHTLDVLILLALGCAAAEPERSVPIAVAPGAVDGPSSGAGGPAPSGAGEPSSAPPLDLDAGVASAQGSGAERDAGRMTGVAVADGCAGHLLCEDFEGQTVGAPPADGWSVTSPNCAGLGVVEVDGTVSHSGGRAIRVDGAQGYCDHVFVTPAFDPSGLAVLHGRFYLRLARPLGPGHVTFVTLRDGSNGRDLRMGGQNQVLMWNRESDDATLPELSPTGTAMSVALPAERWLCLELQVGPGAELRTWLDGTLVPGLVADGEPTDDVDARWSSAGAGVPQIEDLKLGWESYGAQANTLWFDDLVLSELPIGCAE